MNKDFNILVKKIKLFRKKFFLYQLLRGLILLTTVFLVLFLLVNIVEYQFYMPAEWRKVVFFSSLVFIALILLRYVLYPGIMLLLPFKRNQYVQASGMITAFIPEIQDRLINVFELEQSKDTFYSNEILEAAISQKIADMRVFNFSSVVNMKNLKNVGLYLLLSFFLVFSMHMIDSNLFVQAGNRIIHYNTEFVKPAPYKFIWTNSVDNVEKGSSFTLNLECSGDEIPSMMYINIGGNNFLMNNTGENSYSYEINALVTPVHFYFTDLQYNSENHFIGIWPVPVINSFEVEVLVPGYTGQQNQRMENLGDLNVPKGSTLIWNFQCYDTDSLTLVINNEQIIPAEKNGRDNFRVENRFLQSFQYQVNIKTGDREFETAMRYRVDVIEDMYPEINIVQIIDSVKLSRIYFRGTIHDDYGFSRLAFHTHIDMKDSVLILPFNRHVMPQDFYFQADLMDYNQTNQDISYYFSVTDNDAVNGPKTTTSGSYNFIFPKKEDLEKHKNKEIKKIEDLIQESQTLTQELKRDLKELQMKNISKSMSSWEKSQMVNELINKKESLEDILEQIENNYRGLTNFENTFSGNSEEILKKQEQIQELLENVLTDELKKLLDEFNKLSQEFNEQLMNQLSKQMDFTLDDLSKQLDRNLQMLKKMKIEQDIRGIIDELIIIQENQDNLSQKIMDSRDFEDIINKVMEDHQQMEKLENDLKQILLENETLEKPLVFDDFDMEFNDIRDNMRNTLRDLQLKNRRNASGSAKNASEKVKNMVFAMEQMLKMNSSKQNMENIRNLQQILKNLMVLSFDQEDVLTSLKGISESNPDMVRHARKQRELLIQSEMIGDSLYALAKRAPQINSVVNNEMVAVTINLLRSVEMLNEGMRGQASTHQQLVVTATNNLALLLSEILQQIEDQLSNEEGGDGDCEGPGGGKMSGLKEQSDNLRQQLEKMMEQMKNGNQPMGKEIGESLMMHEMMQQMLRDLMNSGSVGESARKQLQDIDRMIEQNRRDLMNRQINPGLVNRHKNIMARLLEAEKSEMEKDQDNKRESNTADEQFYSNPSILEMFQRNQNITLEYLNNSSLKLNNFYQKKVQEYINQLDGVPEN